MAIQRGGGGPLRDAGAPVPAVVGISICAGGGAGVGSAASGGPIAGLEVLPSVSPSSSVLAGVDVTTMPVGGRYSLMVLLGIFPHLLPMRMILAGSLITTPSTHRNSKDLAIAGGALTTGGTLAGLGPHGNFRDLYRLMVASHHAATSHLNCAGRWRTRPLDQRVCRPRTQFQR